MSRRLAPAGHRGSASLQWGMSLLEMVLVIALVAVVALLTATSMGSAAEGRQLRAASRELGTALRHARTQAIVQGREQLFRIDPGARRWEGANGRSGQLPAELQVRFVGAAQLQRSAGEGVIAFHPDGGSSGGRIELRGPRAGWRLDVNWITGQVRGAALEGRR